MLQDLQIFSNTQKSFIFCDYNWQAIDHLSDQWPASETDIYFQKSNDIYTWECGLDTRDKLIKAYLLHGEQFANYIKLGGSSFVLYDSVKEISIASRDFMGNYPLYYYSFPGSKKYIFTFSMNALLASKLFKPAINNAKIIEYIESDLHVRPNNHTFYQHVYRLLPAYKMRISNGKIDELKRYGKFDLSKYQSFTDEEYIEQFRNLFIKSIKKQTDRHKKIAASLSGGLDSSSICSVAQSLKNEPIYTFNFKPNNTATHEDEYIETVVDKWHNTHRTIQSTYSAYRAIKEIIKQNAQPFFVINHTIQLDLIAAAKQKNCTVFLSGHWGDQVVGYGTEYLEELALKEDWKTLKKSIEQHFRNSIYNQNSKESNLLESKEKLIKLYTIRVVWGKLKALKQWTSLPITSWILVRHFNCRIQDFLTVVQKRINRNNPSLRPEINKLICSEILSDGNKIIRENPAELLNVNTTFAGPINQYQKRYLNIIFKGNQTYGQEEYFEIYRQNSIRSAQPFFDAELIELSLSVPLRIKFDEGRKRGTLRRALKDYLPEKNANRITKANFTDHYITLFKDLWKEFDANTPGNHPIWTIINKKVFEEKVKVVLDDQCPSANKVKFMPIVSRVIQLAIWLDYLEDLKE